MAFAPGVSLGGHITTGAGFISDKIGGYVAAIFGWSGNISALGIIGKSIGIFSAGISG